MKLPQTFIGEYSYSGSAGLPSVPFTLDLSRSICGGLHGKIVDDPTLGIPYPAKILGRIRRQRIAFRKDYLGAPFTVRGEAGRESLDDHIARQFGIRLARSIYHPPIFYFGRIENEGQRVEGYWTILPEMVPLFDGRALRVPRSRGYFRLEAKMA